MCIFNLSTLVSCYPINFYTKKNIYYFRTYNLIEQNIQQNITITCLSDNYLHITFNNLFQLVQILYNQLIITSKWFSIVINLHQH